MKSCLFKICAIGLTLSIASCAQVTQRKWEDGGKTYEGTGGTKYNVSCGSSCNIEVWDSGTPPRPYQIISTINYDSPRLPSSQEFVDKIVMPARQIGGDGLVLQHSDTYVTGVYTTSTITPSYTGYNANTTSIPFTRTVSTYMVIKYMDTIDSPPVTTQEQQPIRQTDEERCTCPFSIAEDGSVCGERSAYSRSGGKSPVCY